MLAPFARVNPHASHSPDNGHEYLELADGFPTAILLLG